MLMSKVWLVGGPGGEGERGKGCVGRGNPGNKPLQRRGHLDSTLTECVTILLVCFYWFQGVRERGRETENSIMRENH